MSNILSSKEKVVLVNIDFSGIYTNECPYEFTELVRSAGLEPVSLIHSRRKAPDPQYFIGSGKVEEIQAAAAASKADAIIFNHELSPAQERNLEKQCQCRVIDRVRLILDIFAQRARSHEGKLQVELAQLKHLSTRLVRGWTHLERQKGGIGLRGPGETQLETDRRLIGQRIKHINARLEKVRSQRQQSRRMRKRSDTVTVSLVGYTNAGKSTLFNALTGANVYAVNQLFATLDPTLRRLELSPGKSVVLTDTVGFISNIPHDLIAAFHATLQEVREADLLLHVIDSMDEDKDQRILQVNQVIDEIGAGDVPQLQVYNKIDQHESAVNPRREVDANGNTARVWLSAANGNGLDHLKQAILEHTFKNRDRYQLHVPANAGKLRARLFDSGSVEREIPSDEGGWIMDVLMEENALRQICQESGLQDTLLQ